MIINDYLLTGNNRKMLCGIWRKYQNNEELNGEENNLAGLMALHKDWYKYWESPADDSEMEFNPYVHIAFDTIVMNQIDNNDPPQTRFTYNKLTARGYSHLEAIHEIARIFLKEFYIMQKSEKDFNVKRYAGRLKELK